MQRDSYSISRRTEHALSVSELNRQARQLLERSFLTIEVQGEISNFVQPSSGHWYFTLKDAKAQVRCAMFKNRSMHLRFRPKNGDKVVVRAKVSLYEGRGDYQLICEQMAEGGIGQLQQSFEALKEKLTEEGLFAEQHKQQLPQYAKHLGIITSATGAAIHDILTVLKRRFPALPVSIYPTAVQGDEAPSQICKAIELANKDQRCDVLIVGRGGGSLEDLWAFNDERVARAIFASQLPIISAVGHEVDISISDFVADVRAATPSAAAELISPDQQALRSQVYQLKNRLLRQVKQRMLLQQSRLNSIAARLRHPGERLRERAQQLDGLELRLIQALQQKLQNSKIYVDNLSKRLSLIAPAQRIAVQRNHLTAIELRLGRAMQQQQQSKQQQLRLVASRLNSISPLATLDRGYAIAQKDNGEVIHSSKQVSIGESIETRLHQGKIVSTITDVQS